MKKNSFKGFTTVFKHNLRVHMKSGKYLASTIILSLILFLGMGALLFFLTKSEGEKDKYDYNIDTVYVIDETGLGVPDYWMLANMMGLDYIGDTKFVTLNKTAKEAIEDEAVSYMVVQTKQDEQYLMELITGSGVDSGDEQVQKNLECLAEIVEMGFQNHIYMVSGLNEEQIVQALLPVGTSVEKIGEESEDEGKFAVGIATTMIFVMIVYFMVLIYGSQICADVPMEKTSKLVEQLLMSVSPYALVSGKILSMIVSCIIQFLLWIISLLLGVFAGDLLARSVYGLDESFLSVALDYLDKWFDGMGFTVPAIVMAVLLAVAGLVLYLLLAGLGGATLTKPENAGNVQSVFVLPLIISFFAVLYGTGLSDGSSYGVGLIYNLIPFTAAMSAPASVLMGTLSIPMACVSLAISIAFCLIVLWLAAKVYEGLLFFNGNKLTFKDIISVFKTK